MEIKTCCVTGHRNIPAEQIEYVKDSLLHEIETAIAEGYTHFISGFAEGVDEYFSEIVAEMKKRKYKSSTYCGYSIQKTLKKSAKQREVQDTVGGLFRY